MARHAAVDLSQVFPIPKQKKSLMRDRLPPEELERLCALLSDAGVQLLVADGAVKRLNEYRAMYEPFVWSLSHLLMDPLPAWLPAPNAIDDWESSPTE
jgi:hypothetical protein